MTDTASDKRIAAQFRVSAALAHAELPSEGIQASLEAIATTLGWPVGSFWRVREHPTRLTCERVWCASGVNASEFAEQSRSMVLTPGEGLPGRVLAENRPIWISSIDAQQDFPRRPAATAVGLRSAFAFPAHDARRIVGVLEFFRDSSTEPDPELLQIVEAMGLQIGAFVERAQDRLTIAQSDAFKTAILDAALDCIVGMDEHGAITEFNTAAERTFGWKRDEVIGRDMADVIVPPALREQHRRGLARFLETRAPHLIGRRIEITGVRRDGSEFPVELTIQVIAGDPPRFAGYIRDISERKAQTERLRFLGRAGATLGASLDYEKTLADVAALAVPSIADWCVVDVLEIDGRLRRLITAHADKAKVKFAEELTERYPPRPDAKFGPMHVIESREALYMPEISREMIESAAVDSEHLRLVGKLGLRSTIIVPLLAHGRAVGALTLVTGDSGRRFSEADLDMARSLADRAGVAIDNARIFRELSFAHEQLEQQAAELEAQTAALEEQTIELEEQKEELTTSRDELEAANETLQRTLHELTIATDVAQRERLAADEANRAKSEFLAMMSHELRTPLNAIAGYAQLMEMEIRGPINEAQRLDLQRIRQSQEHLLGLVNDVLNFAKLEAGRVLFHPVDVRVASIVQDVEALILPQVQEKDLHFQLEPGERALCIHADPERTRQVLLNLLSNAVKFTSAGGLIALGWCDGEDHVSIWVRDTGRGIPADKLKAIFEPFVQVDRPLTHGTEGVGLGLAISRDIARAMNGDLTVTSDEGRGSKFVLELPRALTDAPRDGNGARRSAPEHVDHPAPHG